MLRWRENIVLITFLKSGKGDCQCVCSGKNKLKALGLIEKGRYLKQSLEDRIRQVIEEERITESMYNDPGGNRSFVGHLGLIMSLSSAACCG